MSEVTIAASVNGKYMAVEIIALRLRPTRSLFDGSVLSSLPAANGCCPCPLYSVTVLFRVGYLVSDLSFDDRAKLSTEIVAQY